METIAQIQEDIYKRAHGIPGYGVRNHAIDMYDTIKALMLSHKCNTVLDAGTGKGQLILKLLTDGFDVHGIDITDAGLLPNVPPYRFRKIPASQLRKSDKYDAIVCTDMLEHVPIDWLDDTLTSLSRACKKIAIFKVALNKEGHGRFIGEDLHPTILTVDQWYDFLNNYFDEISILDSSIGNAVFLCTR